MDVLLNSKYKIPNYQDGQAYLTSHRLVYVDCKEPRKFSASVDLKDVDRIEYQVRIRVYTLFETMSWRPVSLLTLFLRRLDFSDHPLRSLYTRSP